MFGIKNKLENIYNTLLAFNNNERKRTELAEMKAERLEEENLKLNILVETKNEIISEKDNLINELTKEKEKLYSYLEKTAEILKSNQLKKVKLK